MQKRNSTDMILATFKLEYLTDILSPNHYFSSLQKLSAHSQTKSFYSFQ